MAKKVSEAKLHGIPAITIEYPTISPWNCDLSRFLLVHHDRFGLYDREGDFIETLPHLRADSEPRWSTLNPEWLVYLKGNELWGYNHATGENFRVHKFKEYVKVSGGGEGDISKDGLHLALIGDGEEVFIFNHSTKEKVVIGKIPNLDSVMLTSNNQVIGALKDGPISLYQKNSPPKALTRANGHKDIGRLDGRDYLVWCNSNDPNPIAPNAVVMIDLVDGGEKELLRLPWKYAMNISCSRNGLVLIGTYPKGELLLINMCSGKITDLGPHESSSKSYESQPRPVISPYGERLLYGSDKYGEPNVYMMEVD